MENVNQILFTWLKRKLYEVMADREFRALRELRS